MWGQGWEPTFKVEYSNFLHSGKLQPCQQVQDHVGSDWQWQTAYYDTAKTIAVKSFIVQATINVTNQWPVL